MNTFRNPRAILSAIVVLSSLLMTRAVAQQKTFNLNSPVSLVDASGQSSTSGTTSTGPDNQWHIGFFPYLWFAGMHGTTGILGYNASIKASPGDLLSHLDIGLMGTVEVRKERFVIPVDFIWIALSDDKALPENEPGIESITARAGQFILTPKAGYQIIDMPKFKVDGLVGLRYWHLGQKFHFNPVLLNGVSASQDWVDAVAGGRIETLVAPKASIIIAGDAGGGGASPDYQVVGLLGVKVSRRIAVQAGWRYMDVHYRNNTRLFLYDVATSGVIVGATFYLK